MIRKMVIHARCGYYNSEVRTKIIASIEVVHDRSSEDADLKRERKDLVSQKQTTNKHPSLCNDRKEKDSR